MCDFKKTLPLSLAILISSITNIVNADFSGRWCGDKDSDQNAFSIVISKTENVYKGGYYAVAQSGNKIDDNESAFSFNANHKNTVTTKFKAGISGNIGLIKLKILKDKELDWLVLQSPKGEKFFPNESTLHRCG